MKFIYDVAIVVHVLCVIFWIGAVLFQTLFMAPALLKVDAGITTQVMKALEQRKSHQAITTSAVLVLISGLIVFSISPGFQTIPLILLTSWGKLISVGAIAGILMFIIAMLLIVPNVKKLSYYQAASKESGVRNEQQHLVIKNLTRRIVLFAHCEILLAIIAVVAMVLASH